MLGIFAVLTKCKPATLCSNDPQMTTRSRMIRILVNLLKVAVTFLALWLVLRHFGPDRLFAILAQCDPRWLVLALIVMLLQAAQMTWRWQITTELLLGKHPGYRALLVAFGRSQLYGLPLPSVVGADAIRIAVLAPSFGLREAARSVVCDRLLGLFTMVAIVAVTLPLFAFRVENGPAFGALALASIGGLSAFVVLMFVPRLFGRIPAIGSMIVVAGADLRRLIAINGRAGVVTGQAIITNLIGTVVFMALARSTGTDLSVLDSMLILLPASLVASIPISLNGWGVREATIASAFSFIGADPAQGAAASILFGLIYPLGGLIIECVSWLPRK